MAEHQNLAAALAAVQAALPVVHKGKTANVGQYKYDYADLADVTGSLRRQVELLAASERKLNTILDSVDAFIYLKDRQGRYLFANDKAPMGDVFYDSVGSRADQAIDQWKVENEGKRP